MEQFFTALTVHVRITELLPVMEIEPAVEPYKPPGLTSATLRSTDAVVWLELLEDDEELPEVVNVFAAPSSPLRLLTYFLVV